MTLFRGQKVTRPINAVTDQPYVRNGKAYRLQTWYTDAVRWSRSPSCMVTSKLKALGCCSSHHLQGWRHIVSSPQPATQLVRYCLRCCRTVVCKYCAHGKSRKVYDSCKTLGFGAFQPYKLLEKGVEICFCLTSVFFQRIFLDMPDPKVLIWWTFAVSAVLPLEKCSLLNKNPKK